MRTERDERGHAGQGEHREDTVHPRAKDQPGPRGRQLMAAEHRLERGLDLGHGGRTFAGALGHHPSHEVRQRRGDGAMRAVSGKAGDGREEMRGEDVGGARSQVGRRAGEQLEEQDSQGVDVAAAVLALSRGLLRRHVVRRSEDDPGRRLPRIARPSVSRAIPKSAAWRSRRARGARSPA